MRKYIRYFKIAIVVTIVLFIIVYVTAMVTLVLVTNSYNRKQIELRTVVVERYMSGDLSESEAIDITRTAINKLKCVEKTRLIPWKERSSGVIYRHSDGNRNYGYVCWIVIPCDTDTMGLTASGDWSLIVYITEVNEHSVKCEIMTPEESRFFYQLLII